MQLDNVEDKVDEFYLIMNKFLNEVCPERIVKSKYKPVSWVNQEIKNLMKQRKIFYDWLVINRKHQCSEIIYKAYHEIDKKVKYSIRQSKKVSFSNSYDKAKSIKKKMESHTQFGS